MNTDNVSIALARMQTILSLDVDQLLVTAELGVSLAQSFHAPKNSTTIDE